MALSLLSSFSAPTMDLDKLDKGLAVEYTKKHQADPLREALDEAAKDLEELREQLKEDQERKDEFEESLELDAAAGQLERGEQQPPGVEDADRNLQVLAERHQKELEETKEQIAELREAYALKREGLDRDDREEALQVFDARAEQTLTMLTERQLDEVREAERTREEIEQGARPDRDV
jgi:hypothetical protein